MPILSSALQVARLEASLFGRFPKLRVSVIGIVLIPALYAFIYLSSVWDPASRTANLRATVINQDRGTTVNGLRVDLGGDMTRDLLARRPFGFEAADDVEQAKREVREGRSLFVLIVPEDFSEKAMGAAEPGAGRLVVYASEGNNYAGAGFARRFATELGGRLNQMLSEKRWEAVLGTAASSADRLAQLRDGVRRLREGAHQLDGGLAQARDGADRLAAGAGVLADNVVLLTDGVKQLAAGARAIDARRPAAADLKALKDGAAQLAAGHAEFDKGMAQLGGGARQLTQGAVQLRDQTKTIPLVGGKVSAGAGQLADGARTLEGGLQAAGEGAGRLTAGAAQLSGGVTTLADGFAAYSAAVSTLAGKFPEDGKLEQLATGGRTLADASRQLDAGLATLKGGSAKLSGGIDTLVSALPTDLKGLAGTARGLADSVAPQVEIDAPVSTNGMAFAPNFIPVALWLGATMTAFIFHLRRLPQAAQGRSRIALLTGKLGVLGTIVLAQSLCVLAMAVWLLGVQPVHLAGLALTMAVASLTFMLVILGLVRAFGDAGKAVALILMVLQLSSAGGVMPVELTSEFFRHLSPWLPFTWAVRAVRASLFDAYGGDWRDALGILALFGAGAFLVAAWVGRWRFVPPEEHRPAMDI